MATREVNRSGIITSLFGRRLGIDKDECLVGPVGFKVETESLTSVGSTLTAIDAAGMYLLNLTTAATTAAAGGGVFLLSNPIPGVSVKVFNRYTSTGALGSTATTLLRPSTAFYIESSEGTTMTTVVLSSQGFVELTGISTDRYVVTSRTLTSMASLNGTT